MRTQYPRLADAERTSPSPFADPVFHVLERAAHACAIYLTRRNEAVVPAGDLESLADLLALQTPASSHASCHPAACLSLFRPLLRHAMLPDCPAPAENPEAGRSDAPTPTSAVSAYLSVESRLDLLTSEFFAAYLRSRERLHALHLAQKERAVSGLRRWASSRGFESAEPAAGSDETGANLHGREDVSS